MFTSHNARKTSLLVAVVALLAVIGLPGFQRTAAAQEISVTYSGKQTWVGVPIRITFSVTNAKEISDPVLPTVDGLDIQYGGAVNTTSSISIINGVRTESQSVDLAIDVTPERPGTFTMPPIQIEVDGQIRSTNEMTFEAMEATNDGRLFVDIVRKGGPVYVGEPIELVLRIWIKPFHSDSYDITVSERTMWSLIDGQKSKWGPFRESLEELGRGGRRPSGHLVERAEGEYYVYEIKRELRPTGLGSIEDLDDVVVAVSYPTSLTRSRSRSLLRSNMEFSSLMPIRARAEVKDIDVKPLPEEGRPEYFRGAVGDFIVRAGARPTDVAVGDPITLTFLIGSVDGDSTVLETLRPPPLAEMTELEQSFRIPKDPIAGDLEDTIKIFTQTLRPRSDDVSEIPPIPFSFFDSRIGEYRTVYTQAIPIEVTPAETLAASDIVRAGDASTAENRNEPDPLEDADPLETGLRANFPINQWMLGSTSRTLGVTTAAVLVVPPACFAAVAFLATRRRWKSAHPALVRSRGARRRALAALRRATDIADIGLAVRGYVCDRSGRPVTSLTSAETTRLARKAGADAPILARMDDLLRAAERSGYGGASESTVQHNEEAVQLVQELDRCRWGQPEEVLR